MSTGHPRLDRIIVSSPTTKGGNPVIAMRRNLVALGKEGVFPRAPWRPSRGTLARATCTPSVRTSGAGPRTRPARARVVTREAARRRGRRPLRVRLILGHGLRISFRRARRGTRTRRPHGSGPPPRPPQPRRSSRRRSWRSRPELHHHRRRWFPRCCSLHARHATRRTLPPLVAVPGSASPQAGRPLCRLALASVAWPSPTTRSSAAAAARSGPRPARAPPPPRRRAPPRRRRRAPPRRRRRRAPPRPAPPRPAAPYRQRRQSAPPRPGRRRRAS